MKGYFSSYDQKYFNVFKLLLSLQELKSQISQFGLTGVNPICRDQTLHTILVITDYHMRFSRGAQGTENVCPLINRDVPRIFCYFSSKLDLIYLHNHSTTILI